MRWSCLLLFYENFDVFVAFFSRRSCWWSRSASGCCLKVWWWFIWRIMCKSDRSLVFQKLIFGREFGYVSRKLFWYFMCQYLVKGTKGNKIHCTCFTKKKKKVKVENLKIHNFIINFAIRLWRVFLKKVCVNFSRFINLLSLQFHQNIEIFVHSNLSTVSKLNFVKNKSFDCFNVFELFFLKIILSKVKKNRQIPRCQNLKHKSFNEEKSFEN